MLNVCRLTGILIIKKRHWSLYSIEQHFSDCLSFHSSSSLQLTVFHAFMHESNFKRESVHCWNYIRIAELFKEIHMKPLHLKGYRKLREREFSRTKWPIWQAIQIESSPNIPHFWSSLSSFASFSSCLFPFFFLSKPKLLQSSFSECTVICIYLLFCCLPLI